MTEIEKARDGIFQRLLVAQGPMSRSVVKSIMSDIDELIKLHKAHECLCRAEPSTGYGGQAASEAGGGTFSSKGIA